ncbi:ribosomal RNA-processing protein 17 [Musa acuminata AAA Group]|uniref:ribosomal RNA-processing protein 17 n=1 Tax=Musa acuminata AAA Group TaxID=214697 RepID=UPI0031D4AF20
MSGEEEDDFDEGVVVGQLSTVMVPKHIKKRALRNKALTVGFNDKELRDFVTGFHKRKKKRRKEAQRQLQEKDRLKRIEARKKRKQEREMALYGRVLSSENPLAAVSEPDNAGDSEQDNQDMMASVSETKMYEDEDTTITVTTSAISHEKDDFNQTNAIPMVGSKAEKRQGLDVKKKPLKRVAKHRSNKKGGKKPPPRKHKKGRNK